MIAFFTHLLTPFISAYGLVAVFVFMLLESALIPIPSEVTMPFAGYLVSQGVTSFATVVFIGALGNLVGSLLAYWLGYKMGDRLILSAIRKWGKYLFIKETEYIKSKKWFAKHGLSAAFYARLLPVVRTYISLPAGIAKADVTRFAVVTFVGSAIWSTVLTWFGLQLGANWQAIEPYFHDFQLVVFGVMGVLVLLFFWRKFKKAK